MNTVQHKRTQVVRHELHMAGPITARDLHDFVTQVERMYEEAVGVPRQHDNSYMVTGDDEGLTATFETLREASVGR
jgi:hypothetical protein